MPRAITYNCDICGAQRKEANHWFAVYPAGEGITFLDWKRAMLSGRLDIIGVSFICGQACAHKLLDQFLNPTSESE
jgi:hypothetical protein